MKKINFSAHILPHVIAVAVFLVVTVFFFNPVFFDNKTLEQHDIQQFLGSSKSIADYRKETGNEALWTNAMFGGMPAYLISVEWSNQPVGYLKRVLSLSLIHPICNIYLAFLCYYIMLLAFGVRPYLAIAGAIAFGLSSYMIVGLGAGHNGRIGAIAFMPLVIAGIHLAFSGKKILGFGVTTAGLALHLRENHLQITYYMVLIVAVYGLVRLVEAVREKRMVDFGKTVGLLIPAVLIAVGTYFGQFWAITEYTRYSIRGASELSQPGVAGTQGADGLSKDYAFAYKYGIGEPITLLVPEFYGGSSGKLFVQDKKSKSYQALVNSSDNQTANQLAGYTSAYWGPQSFTGAPYYAGAIVVFLFVVGILFANRRYVWWLVPLSVLSLMLSWGDSFASFNYFMFDYFPGYNKFRSVNFALVIILFAMPLLGLLGVEKLWLNGVDKAAKKKLLLAFGVTGGLCFIFVVFAGMFGFTKEVEAQLPGWFVDALIDDRKSLLRGDAFRSLAFILAIFIVLYFDVQKKVSPLGFYALLTFFITIDLAIVDKRYFTQDNFKRKRENTFFATTEADQEILKDKSSYRVYNLQEAFSTEARTSYYFQAVGGYHGAKIRRYQDFYDSCLFRQTQQLYTDAQQGKLNMPAYSGINMLNVKYLVYGPQRNNIITNPAANGNAWFVQSITKVNSPTEELRHTCSSNTKNMAVVDASKFEVPDIGYDSAGTITLTEQKPNYLKYQSSSKSNSLAVFSEIYYAEGWKALIDGQEAPILRADYILRALVIPAGDHSIEFKFEPDAYHVGNKITMASSWLMLLLLLGSVGWSLRKEKSES
ncbi:MAG: YfhO family protein [Bacteroidota bacterium]